MITLSQFQSLLGDTFFTGNDVIAGIVIYVVTLLIIFVMSKKMTVALVVSLPVTYIFSLLGVLNNEVMILMIIVTVLGLAYTTRDIWRD